MIEAFVNLMLGLTKFEAAPDCGEVELEEDADDDSRSEVDEFWRLLVLVAAVEVAAK